MLSIPFGRTSQPHTPPHAHTQVGNLANDGFKLASGGSGKCSAEPEDGLEAEAKGGTLRYVAHTYDYYTTTSTLCGMLFA